MAGLTSEEQDAAAAMYDHLVTPSGTKIAHGVGDLARYAHVPEPDAASVLQKLARERILRGTADDGGAGVRYEIFHDVLADAVLAWRARHEEEEAVARAHEQRRRARFVAAAALAGLLIVAAIAIFALVERSNARSQADRARAGEFVARALNLLNTDPAGSVRLAYDAARLEPGLPEEDALGNALSKDRLRTTMHTGGRVTVAAFDPSANRVLVASTDGEVRLYRRGSTRAIRVFRHGAPVQAAVLGGRLLLSGGTDGKVRIWDARSGKLLHTLDAHGPVRTLVFGLHRSVLLTVAQNGTVRLWSARTWRPLSSLRTHIKTKLVNAVLDPAAKRVFAVTDDRFLRVYSVRTGRLIRRLKHDGFVRAVVFSPNGRLLLTSDHGGTIRLWRATDLRLVRELHGALRNVPVAVWSRDGKKIAAASSDGTARLWDAATGNQVAIMIGHTNEVTSVAFNPAGDAVVSTSADHTARVWGATPDKGGRLLSVLAGHTSTVTSASFSSDGRSVLTAADDGTARLWDPGSEPNLEVVFDAANPLTAFAVNAAGDRILIGDHDGQVRVLSLPGARVLESFQTRGPAGDVAFGPTRPVAVVAPLTAIAFSARGNLVATADDRAVHVGPVDRPPHRTLRPEGSPIHDLAFSPDGRTLAVALDDGTAQLWDVDTGRLSRTLHAHTNRVLGVAYSRDGKLLVTASRDRDAKIWNPVTGALVRLLHGHFGPVLAAAFSPDDRWVVTAGPTTAGLWNVASGDQTFLSGPTKAPIIGAAFAGPDGRTVVTAGADGTVRTFRCGGCGNIEELLAIAKRRLGRG
jgi:WD40 repeat protein